MTLMLMTSQVNAGELLMDCHFGRQIKTFSLAALDLNDGSCHIGNFDKKEGPVNIRYQIELCGMDVTGSVMVSSLNNNQWETLSEFTSKKECQLRRKIETVPGPRCSPARSRC